MVGSIERLWRQVVERPIVPMMILVVGINAPDPERRGTTGYGGVLPVPGPSVTPSASTERIDPMLDAQRREARIGRGRVLYAAGHGPTRVVPPVARVARKGPCPQQRVVQGRDTLSPSPRS